MVDMFFLKIQFHWNLFFVLKRLKSKVFLFLLPFSRQKKVCYKYIAGKSGRREGTFLPLLTALPFSRQKNTLIRMQCREVGKTGRGVFTDPYRLTVFPAKKSVL